MHVRFSTALGMPVMEESGGQEIGSISGIFIHPDNAKIEGFYVRIPGFLQSQVLFLSTMDIVHWGSRVRVRGRESLTPLEELVRLHALNDEDRPVLGQKILTEDSMLLGTCRDIQFDTIAFHAESIFPKKMWKWGVAIPVTSIVEVKKEAIIVRNAVTLPETVEAAPSVLETLDPLGSGAASRVVERRTLRQAQDDI
jgi:uncharacterized protein YrrD